MLHEQSERLIEAVERVAGALEAANSLAITSSVMASTVLANMGVLPDEDE